MQEPDVRRIGTEPQALEAFYRDHIDAVSRFVARRVDDPHLVADMVADAFLAAIDAASSYRPDRGSPRGWLFGITRHVVADELRRQGREARAVRLVGGRRLLDPESLARVVEQIDAERDAREVTAVLDCLDPADRHLFELVALDGLTLTDVAHLLGVKPTTARVRPQPGLGLIYDDQSACDVKPDWSTPSELPIWVTPIDNGHRLTLHADLVAKTHTVRIVVVRGQGQPVDLFATFTVPGVGYCGVATPLNSYYRTARMARDEAFHVDSSNAGGLRLRLAAARIEATSVGRSARCLRHLEGAQRTPSAVVEDVRAHSPTSIPVLLANGVRHPVGSGPRVRQVRLGLEAESGLVIDDRRPGTELDSGE